jgi:heme-degrading monooxygenase HmoA
MDAIDEPEFAIMFEYRVPSEHVAEFEHVYGSDGAWARFFGQDPAYRGSELWFAEAGRYLVVDRWGSSAAYRAFRERHRGEYEQRSAETASLYASERVIGEMARR